MPTQPQNTNKGNRAAKRVRYQNLTKMHLEIRREIASARPAQTADLMEEISDAKFGVDESGQTE